MTANPGEGAGGGLRIGLAGCRLLLMAAAEQGIAGAPLLRAAGIAPAQLEDPGAEIEAGQQLAMLVALHDQLGERARGLGLVYGLRMKLTFFGIWGYALMSSPTLHEAMQLGSRFLDLSGSPARVSFDYGTELTRVRVDVGHLPARIRPFASELVAATMISLQQDMFDTPLPVPLRELSFAHPPQAAPHRYREVFGIEPRFGVAADGASFDSRLLALRPRRSHALTWKMCVGQCQALLEQRRARHGIAGRIREQLSDSPERLPALAQMAARLGLSADKLRRQLAAEQTSYRALVDEFRHLLALELLRQPGIQVQAVALRLGYGSSIGFSQSFRRWTGMTPSDYQRQEQRQEAAPG